MKKIYNAFFLMNVIFQSFFNLVLPVAIAFGLGYLLVAKLSLPEWIYVPLIILGVFAGLFSMVKFLIYTLKTFEKIEEEQYEFIATIIGAYDSSILVEPEEGTNERKSSDKISMKITRPTNGVNDFYVVGNKVKITYNGMIMESYPAQIVATKIELAK